MTLTTDQPIHAATLKSAMMIPPTQPKAKREMVIWRRPNFGPSVEKKATGRTPKALKMMITATLSQKPRRSEEHTSELQSLTNLVCRLLLEKKNIATRQRRGHD